MRQGAVQPVCEKETEKVHQCYKDKSKNPLACADLIAAFESCALRSRVRQYKQPMEA